MPLDEFLPDHDVNEVHSTRVAAPPQRVLAAVRELTSREVPLLVGLMALRTLPAVLLRRRPFRLRRDLERPILRQAARGGFVVLAERPDELVLGVVGRFLEERRRSRAHRRCRLRRIRGARLREGGDELSRAGG